MIDSEISREFWQAKTWCQDCYNVRTRVQPKETVYTSPTPEQRTENALNALQKIINLGKDEYASTAREAVGRCRGCLKNGKPEGPLIFEYLRKQMM